MAICAKCKSEFKFKEQYAFCPTCQTKIKKGNKFTIQQNLTTQDIAEFKKKKFTHYLKVH